jgi:hypothetical protein
MGVAPYDCSIHEFCAHFGWSASRRSLLFGLLDLRSELRRLGLLNGVQWLNGSFTEHVEKSENREPRDIDVLTIFHRPASASTDAEIGALVENNPRIFDPRQSKMWYGCDHYAFDLSPLSADEIVQRACYWNSLFTHRRNGAWKGFIRLPPEDEAGDLVARARLEGAT